MPVGRDGCGCCLFAYDGRSVSGLIAEWFVSIAVLPLIVDADTDQSIDPIGVLAAIVVVCDP